MGSAGSGQSPVAEPTEQFKELPMKAFRFSEGLLVMELISESISA
jgi:hypothetical protein